MKDDLWPLLNRVRGILIDRKVTGEATPAELVLLEALQVYADSYFEPWYESTRQMLEKTLADLKAEQGAR